MDRPQRQDPRRRFSVVRWRPPGERLPLPWLAASRHFHRDGPQLPLLLLAFSPNRSPSAPAPGTLLWSCVAPTFDHKSLPNPQTPSLLSLPWPIPSTTPSPPQFTSLGIPHYLPTRSSMRTGTLGSPTATSCLVRTAWSWCGTTRDSGAMCPATTTCPTPAGWGWVRAGCGGEGGDDTIMGAVPSQGKDLRPLGPLGVLDPAVNHQDSGS